VARRYRALLHEFPCRRGATRRDLSNRLITWHAGCSVAVMAQHSKSKKQTIRRPFLITVATLAGSMTAGCGGAVTGGESGGTGSGDTTAGGTGGGSSASTTGTTSVTSGTSTSWTVSGQSVGTGWAGAGGAGGYTGAGGGTASCPVAQPVNGSTCANSGQTCPYLDPFCDSGTISLACVAGRWSPQSFPSCNPPPPPPCPAAEPTVGSSCFSLQTQSCSYPVLCCGAPRGQHTYECSAGAWRRSPGSEADASGCFPPPLSCPAIAPYDGEPCCFNAPLGGACFYGCRTNPDGGSLFSPTAFCDGKQWRVSYGSCPLYEGIYNPPADTWRGPFDGGGEESGPD
jgi:hypothetical protein